MGTPSPNGGDKPQSVKKGQRVIPFGKYLLLDRLAVGGMAEVFTAKSFGIEGFEKILAIKRILPTVAEDPDFIEMFIDEAKIAGQLSHANICPIYELGQIGDAFYIAMEFVWGKDVLQVINRFRRQRKRMSPVMAAFIASKICEALDYAHRKKDRHGKPLGIVHRDLSPQNILISYEGEIKLIDFGIAKAASRTTKTHAGVLKGKFGYMSPEQVRGLDVDHRSDLFAVGTCLYEMVSGDRLFKGESEFATLEKIRNAEVAKPTELIEEFPVELESIILKALSPEREDRYQSAADLVDALHRFLSTQRPPFGTSKLSAWMKSAFAPEMTKEKERADAFAQIGRPSDPNAAARPSIQAAPEEDPSRSMIQPRLPGSEPPPEDAVEAEATVIVGGDEDPVSVNETIPSQPTQIFFSSDDEESSQHSAPDAVGMLASEPTVLKTATPLSGTATPPPSGQEPSTASTSIGANAGDTATTPANGTSVGLVGERRIKTAEIARTGRLRAALRGEGPLGKAVLVVVALLVVGLLLSVGAVAAYLFLPRSRHVTLEVWTQPRRVVHPMTAPASVWLNTANVKPTQTTEKAP